jgi:hypothetical protein
MRRLLRITVALSAALTPLMAEATFSRPMPRAADFPTAPNPQVNVPVCYIETTSGTTFDLVSLCGSNVAPAAATNNGTPAADNPTNAPNAGNPATPNPNAVTRDAAGTPITTPAGTATPGNPTVGNPGTSPTGTPNNTNPGTSPTGTPNNTNPGTSPTGTPNNTNPGTSPTSNPNNTNPGTSPTSNPNSNLSPNGGTAGDGSDGLNRNINLPRVPPSSFGP